MIHDEAHRMVHEYERNLQMQGLSLDQFFKFTGMTEEKLVAEYEEQAKKRVTYRLVLDAIIKKEKISASDKEVDKEIDEISKKYNMTKEEFTNQYGTETIKYEIQFNKVIDLLKGNKAEKKTVKETAKKTTKKTTKDEK